MINDYCSKLFGIPISLFTKNLLDDEINISTIL